MKQYKDLLAAYVIVTAVTVVSAWVFWTAFDYAQNAG